MEKVNQNRMKVCVETSITTSAKDPLAIDAHAKALSSILGTVMGESDYSAPRPWDNKKVLFIAYLEDGACAFVLEPNLKSEQRDVNFPVLLTCEKESPNAEECIRLWIRKFERGLFKRSPKASDIKANSSSDFYIYPLDDNGEVHDADHYLLVRQNSLKEKILENKMLVGVTGLLLVSCLLACFLSVCFFGSSLFSPIPMLIFGAFLESLSNCCCALWPTRVSVDIQRTIRNEESSISKSKTELLGEMYEKPVPTMTRSPRKGE